MGVGISFCIVTFRARQVLQDCLESLLTAPPGVPYEVIVMDNGSADGIDRMMAEQFPWVQFENTGRNLGYTQPMNMALRKAKGRYLVQLNADTILHPGAFDVLYRYCEIHPEVGICTPKVLNRDGTLQRQCRRGEARPWEVFTYFSGLWRVFPKSRFFGGYLLNYLPEDAVCEVGAVSGSCMFIRREVIEQIGFLDEAYFAYQEDTDFCVRARRAGWKVIYLPEAKITHLGGQSGSRVQPYHAIFQWHRSYFLYYRKNLARDYFFLFNWFYYMLMGIKLGISLLAAVFRKEKFVGSKKP